MRSPLWCGLLLLLIAPISFAGDSGKDSSNNGNAAAAAGNNASISSTSPAEINVVKSDIEELRQQVKEQRQTIEELKALVQQLVQAKSPASGNNAQVVNATLTAPASGGADVEFAETQKPADKDKKDSGPTAGWNGEHFYIKSPDGQFQLQPNGYFQNDYRAYKGDGAPPDTFLIRRARFGFLGNYGKYYDFGVLIDAAASNGITLRDLYINMKPSPAFQVQVGQFKEPFAQELVEGVTNIDFVERSLASLLYPSAATAFRSPGIQVRGDISGGTMQYWFGAFNGKGILTNNTTNEPELIGRVRFYPWKKKKDSIVQGFAIGGSVGYGKTRGLSNETSFSGAMPDGAYTFFPSFLINGPVERFNGELAWVHGRWGLRGEYDQLLQMRRGIGSQQSGGLGFTDLPGIRARAGYAYLTYMLTGETKPENAPPKVRHPVLGPSPEGSGGPGWGAWEVAFRYDKILAKEPGVDLTANTFTPGFVAAFNNHTEDYTFGVNWYLNYWVKYMADFGVDRLQQPSTIGVLPQNYFVVLQRLQFRF
jgi:phosphate-selective porin